MLPVPHVPDRLIHKARPPYTQGVIDLVKVVRTALQDAASIAGLLVTTEAMVAEKPKKDAPLPAMPSSGMDF